MQPEEAPLELLSRVHTAEYLAKLEAGTLSDQEIRRLGVPWSPRLWRRSRLAAAGTLLAARAALEDGLAGNLAGGTHHAFADRGEGFCVLNDVAVAVRALQDSGEARRALVVDLDVHQGNGTAAIFAGDADVFTLSLHGERNYPTQKMRSTLDVGLPDGTGDEAYLAALEQALATALSSFEPDVVFYLAGVDPAAGDRYGRLALTEDGLRRRDRFVVGTLRDRGLPVVLLLAGRLRIQRGADRRTARQHLPRGRRRRGGGQSSASRRGGARLRSQDEDPEILMVETVHQPGSLARVLAVIAEAGLIIDHLNAVRREQGRTLWEITLEMDEDTDRGLYARIDALPTARFVGKSDRVFDRHRGGKLRLTPSIPINTQQVLRDIYTPGVARVCLAIRDNPELAWQYTSLDRTVAVITNGTAVLGLGNIGPLAGLPVMEGKAALFAGSWTSTRCRSS
jgi:acetoin utilization deacetylase AcuC-like enzyme